jgi:hypothetical protein
MFGIILCFASMTARDARYLGLDYREMPPSSLVCLHLEFSPAEYLIHEVGICELISGNVLTGKPNSQELKGILLLNLQVELIFILVLKQNAPENGYQTRFSASPRLRKNFGWF